MPRSAERLSAPLVRRARVVAVLALLAVRSRRACWSVLVSRSCAPAHDEHDRGRRTIVKVADPRGQDARADRRARSGEPPAAASYRGGGEALAAA